MNQPLKLIISKQAQSGVTGYTSYFEYINRNRYSGYICIAYSDTLWASFNEIAVQDRLTTYSDIKKVETRKPL